VVARDCLTDAPGVAVGHAEDAEACTGCTVILFPDGATGGVDVRGRASGTRELGPLEPNHLVQQAHAVCLAGGSAYGLDATGGVMSYLESQGIGFPVRVTTVPIVPSAIIFDLALGRSDVRPDGAMGYAAAKAAVAGASPQGNVGVGMGATVGKLFGLPRGMKGGFGTASCQAPGGIVVGAAAAVNAFGDVRDPVTGLLQAGARDESGTSLVDTAERMRQGASRTTFGGENTTLGVVVVGGALSREECIHVARMAQTGLARVVSPAHTNFDGDVVFAFATGHEPADVNTAGMLAQEALARAIGRAVIYAERVGDLPAACDLGALDPSEWEASVAERNRR
jgi:L-aminopeptidase/D-esterase-like protein